jgi:peptide/nickel transport system substrate-binding protein
MPNQADAKRDRGCRTATMLAAAVAIALATAADAGAAENKGRHALAMHGEPALAAGFPHFPYANPDAPQGGRLTLGTVGSFDSLNQFIVKGIAPAQIRGYVVESLLIRGYDEPFTLYGLLADSVATDAARSQVTFTLDPRARFSDGAPVTPADVLFSWQLLRDKGRPTHRSYYSKVARAEAIGERAVRFHFEEGGDRELPLILGLMPVLARHATDAAKFEETSFTAPLGSGPYTVAEVRPGERFVLKRNPGYWGRDLGANRGFWNFDELRFDYYRDANSEFEAFKRGLSDVRAETDPGRWEQAYDIPPVRDGRIVKESFDNGLPKGMTAFVFNTRRPLFSDVRVREALALLFDFEWVNRNFFFDHYRRTASYFDGSELSSHRRPADAAERALLQPFPDTVRADILDGKWSPAVSDGSGRDREQLKAALTLLSQAGWEVEDGTLRERASGRPFTFEILATSKDHERLALAYLRDLRRAGIAATVRLVDATQFERRRDSFDFDMLPNQWVNSLSPGNEQSIYWGTAAADQPGSRNYMGAREPAVDALIAALLAAPDRQQFVAAARALDRVLLSGFYVLPLFHLPGQWVARSRHIGRPQRTSLFGYLPETWWREPRT